MSLHALFIGYATIDEIDGQQYPGGAGGSMALNAAQMNIQATLCAPFSQDANGKFYQKLLDDRSIDISLCLTNSPGIPVCTINDLFGAGSTRSWQSNGADTHFSTMKLEEKDLEPFGLIFLCNAAPSIVREVAKNVNSKKVVYIPGPQVVNNPDWVVPEIFSSTEILFSNQEETAVLELLDPLNPSITHWVKTLGEEGGRVCLEEEEHQFSPAPTKNLVDSTGAGDSFALAYSVEWYYSHDVQSAVEAGKKRASKIIQQQGMVLHE